jgi:hypothetical protein
MTSRISLSLCVCVMRKREGEKENCVVVLDWLKYVERSQKMLESEAYIESIITIHQNFIPYV